MEALLDDRASSRSVICSGLPAPRRGRPGRPVSVRLSGAEEAANWAMIDSEPAEGREEALSWRRRKLLSMFFSGVILRPIERCWRHTDSYRRARCPVLAEVLTSTTAEAPRVPRWRSGLAKTGEGLALLTIGATSMRCSFNRVVWARLAPGAATALCFV